MSTLAQGQTTHAGDGGYIMGAPVYSPGAFTLVGGGLVKVASGHWAGLTVGVAQSTGCPALLPYRSSVASTFSRLLRGMALKRAAVGKLV